MPLKRYIKIGNRLFLFQKEKKTIDYTTQAIHVLARLTSLRSQPETAQGEKSM
jgi:hypothetical protein